MQPGPMYACTHVGCERYGQLRGEQRCAACGSATSYVPPDTGVRKMRIGVAMMLLAVVGLALAIANRPQYITDPVGGGSYAVGWTKASFAFGLIIFGSIGVFGALITALGLVVWGHRPPWLEKR